MTLKNLKLLFRTRRNSLATGEPVELRIELEGNRPPPEAAYSSSSRSFSFMRSVSISCGKPCGTS